MPEDNTKIETGSLQRGLAIMDTLFAAQRSLTLSEVADRTNLSTATAYRLLTTLVQTGHVSRDDAKHYLPGMQVMLPLDQYHPLSALRRAASERLRGLRIAFGLTAFFVLFNGTDRYVLELLPGADPFSPHYRVKLALPMHGSVTGKLYLAQASAEERTRLLGPEPYHAATPKTLTSRAALDEELERVAAQRFAETRQEVFEDMYGLGAPIFLSSGLLFGAVVLSGPFAFCESDQQPEAVRQLQRTVELFSHASPDLRSAARFLNLYP